MTTTVSPLGDVPRRDAITELRSMLTNIRAALDAKPGVDAFHALWRLECRLEGMWAALLWTADDTTVHSQLLVEARSHYVRHMPQPQAVTA